MADATQTPTNHQISLIKSGENQQQEDEDIVETDPTGRFERYRKHLGKGAYKEVYKAYDQEDGVEVAWNQIRITSLNQPDVNRIHMEIQILQSLRNENIINLLYSWRAPSPNSPEKDDIFFITEFMSSGSLKSYIKKTKGMIKSKIIRNWCKQILNGLHYLHTRENPIIHRDLKCENIFINGNNGQAKIGDLGLAVVKATQHLSSVLGTPEFMAPELYDENYDEKVDIYAFGMVILEIATKAYPYSECTNQAQIYRKVTTGVKPAALQQVTDPEIKAFIDLCIEHDPKKRPSATELLQHPFFTSNTLLQPSGASTVDLESNTSGSPSLTSPATRNSTIQHSSLPPTSSTSAGGFGSFASLSSNSSSLSASKPPSVNVNASVNAPKSSSAPSFSIGPSSSTSSLPIEEKTPNQMDTPRKSSNVSSSSAASEAVEISKPIHGEVESDQHLFYISRHHTPLKPNVACDVEAISAVSESDEVTLKMTYHSGTSTCEIKFPFNLSEDTATDVVSELVKEDLILAIDEQLTRRRIEEAIRGVLIRQRQKEKVEKIVSDTDVTADIIRKNEVTLNGGTLTSNDTPHEHQESATSIPTTSIFPVAPSAIFNSSNAYQTLIPSAELMSLDILSRASTKIEVDEQHNFSTSVPISIVSLVADDDFSTTPKDTVVTTSIPSSSFDSPPIHSNYASLNYPQVQTTQASMNNTTSSGGGGGSLLQSPPLPTSPTATTPTISSSRPIATAVASPSTPLSEEQIEVERRHKEITLQKLTQLQELNLKGFQASSTNSSSLGGKATNHPPSSTIPLSSSTATTQVPPAALITTSSNEDLSLLASTAATSSVLVNSSSSPPPTPHVASSVTSASSTASSRDKLGLQPPLIPFRTTTPNGGGASVVESNTLTTPT